MKRTLKILARIVAGILLAVVFVPLLCALLLEIPAVQNYVVHRATEFATEKLGTRISIDRVHLGLLYRARVEGFYVEDFEGDTLLYANRLDARLNGLSPLTLGSVRLSGGVLNLRDGEDGVLNIKALVDKLRNPDKPKKNGFTMRINSIQVDGLNLHLAVSPLRYPEYGVDYGNMRFDHIRAGVSGFEVTGAAVRMQIENVSFEEPSGFVLTDLDGALRVDEGLIELKELHFRTPRSNLTMPLLSFMGTTAPEDENAWASYKYFIDRVAIHAEVTGSTLSSDDVAYFAPALRDRGILLTDADATMEGPVKDFQATVHANAMHDTRLDVEARVTGLPSVDGLWVDSKKIEIRTSSRDVRQLAGDALPKAVVGIVDGLGAMTFKGNVRGGLNDFQGRAELSTAQGALQLDGRKWGKAVKGLVQTTDFRLGQVLGVKMLGSLTMTARLDGVVDGAATHGNVDARIATLEANGYAYHDLSFAGDYEEGHFDGRATSRDPNLDFDFEGLVSFAAPPKQASPAGREVPRYDFTLDLKRADLAATRINKRDSISVLSTRLRARARGRTVDDLDGVIEMTGARYAYNGKEIHADTIRIVGRNDSLHRFIDLRSEFLDARYEGASSYKDVWDYLLGRSRSYVPLLTDDGYASPDSTRLRDGMCTLTVDVKHLDPITDALASGLMVADGSSLDLEINPRTDHLSLQVKSDYVERGRMLVTRVDVDAHNQGDSLLLAASTEDLYMNGFHLSNVRVGGAAKKEELTLTLDFADTTSHTSAHLGTRIQFGKTTRMQLTPSYLTSMGTTWQILADEIAFAGGRVQVDRFRLTHGDQELEVDGVASRNVTDSIRLSLHNFDLSPLSGFTAPIGYTVRGRTNGYATMHSALHNGQMRADIQVDSMTLNEHKIPDLWLKSRWDVKESQAGVMVLQKESLDTLAWGFYSPSQKAYYARAMWKGVPVGVIDPVLKGVLTQTDGTADVDVMVDARRGKPVFTGSIGLHDFSTVIDYTKVRYRVPDRVIEIRDSQMRLDSVMVHDVEGNSAGLSLLVDFGSLPNVSFNVTVTPRQLMVINTTAKDSDLFYGRVYASGRAEISGDNSGVKMNITARTDDNSSFFMPLSGKSNVSAVDFVTFKVPDVTDSMSYMTRKRLLVESLNRKKKGDREGGNSLELEMMIDVRDNTAFQLVIDPTVGDIIRGRGNGQLSVRVNPSTELFEMLGDYTLTEGNYLFTLPGLPISSKRFTLGSGSSIQWTGEPLDALLDITALYHMKASLRPLLGDNAQNTDRTVPVDCGIHIGGRLVSPELTFSVDVPVSDTDTQEQVAAALQNNETKQFVYLVFFGGFAPESMMSGGTGLTAATGVATGLELVTNMVTSWLSTEQYSILFNYKPGSEMSGEELDFGFSTNLVNNRLLVEVEGNYVLDNRQAVASGNTSTFNGSANVTWLIDKSGNFRLRAFTQTIDRFDETQGLQETGLGISYREDFDDLPDLKRRTRARFASNREERRTKKEARKERREQKDSLRDLERDSIKLEKKNNKNLKK